MQNRYLLGLLRCVTKKEGRKVRVVIGVCLLPDSTCGAGLDLCLFAHLGSAVIGVCFPLGAAVIGMFLCLESAGLGMLLPLGFGVVILLEGASRVSTVEFYVWLPH